MLSNRNDYSLNRSTNEGSIPESEPVTEPDIPETSAILSQPGVGPSPQTGVKDQRICFNLLKQGCYVITYRPIASLYVYRGTLRVDRSEGTTISGDLYKFREIVPQGATNALLANFMSDNTNAIPNDGGMFEWPNFSPSEIPVYPRRNYYSYLKVTNIQYNFWQCNVTLTIEEYLYTQPQAGSFDGSFPINPSREFTVVLSKKGRPGFANHYWEGSLFANGYERGSFTLTWVSPYFRKARLGITELEGTTAPYPHDSEWFHTIFADAGWELFAEYIWLGALAPAGVDPNECWENYQLHQLMTHVQNKFRNLGGNTDLDKVWYLHLLVIPAKMGCNRGLMFDDIDTPREGTATFCDDGYPTSDSSHFGTAANKKQRDVARAYLRSACHELGHAFNQVHQGNTDYLGEPNADNSIMTTTPDVADFLAGPAPPPGVFPDDISLKFNSHVKHHLVHFPDPVVRPGGMGFEAGHPTRGQAVPQALTDRHFFAPDQLELNIQPFKTRLKIGEPCEVDLKLTNKSKIDIPFPTDIRPRAQHTFITVTKPNRESRLIKSFVIQTDHVSIRPLKPGAKINTHISIFWSSNGFAFETPGRHMIEAEIRWNYRGYLYGVKARADVWLDFPTSDKDNEVASLLLHKDVGKFVALGGAPHLKEAVARINKAASISSDHPSCRSMIELIDDHKRKLKTKNKPKK